MSVLNQIKEDANEIVNTMTLQILDVASQSLFKDRFLKLRKKKAYPVTEDEQRYMHCLNMYVRYKLQLRKFNYIFGPSTDKTGYFELDWTKRSTFEREMLRYRAEMDRIEFGPDSVSTATQTEVWRRITESVTVNRFI